MTTKPNTCGQCRHYRRRPVAGLPNACAAPRSGRARIFQSSRACPAFEHPAGHTDVPRGVAWARRLAQRLCGGAAAQED